MKAASRHRKRPVPPVATAMPATAMRRAMETAIADPGRRSPAIPACAVTATTAPASRTRIKTDTCAQATGTCASDVSNARRASVSASMRSSAVRSTTATSPESATPVPGGAATRTRPTALTVRPVRIVLVPARAVSVTVGRRRMGSALPPATVAAPARRSATTVRRDHASASRRRRIRSAAHRMKGSASATQHARAVPIVRGWRGRMGERSGRVHSVRAWTGVATRA